MPDLVGRTLEAFRLQDGNFLLVGTWGGNASVRVEPFDAAEIEFTEIWGREREPRSAGWIRGRVPQVVGLEDGDYAWAMIQRLRSRIA